jgi:hypothetical protein
MPLRCLHLEGDEAILLRGERVLVPALTGHQLVVMPETCHKLYVRVGRSIERVLPGNDGVFDVRCIIIPHGGRASGGERRQCGDQEKTIRLHSDTSVTTSV